MVELISHESTHSRVYRFNVDIRATEQRKAGYPGPLLAAKRKSATADKINRNTADDSAAVLSIAIERDLFEWSRSAGITVERNRAKVER